MSNKQKVPVVPKLRFPEFRGEREWEVHALSSVATVVMGSSPKSEFYNEDHDGLPLLQGNADIKNRLSAPRIFTSEITKECHVNDILMSVRAPVGSVAKAIHHACIGRGIASIKSKKPNSQEFLYQWLLSYESRWANISQGGTFDAINSDDLKGVVLTTPLPTEQQKIAECLSSLDELIVAQARKVSALKNHKKGLTQQLFPREGETQPRLRFPKFQHTGAWRKQKVSALLTKSVKPVNTDSDTTYREIGIRSHGKGIFHKEPISGKAIGDKRVFWVVQEALVLNIVFAWEQAVAVTSPAENGMIASHRFPMYSARPNKADVHFIRYFFLSNKGKELLGIASPGGAGRNKTLGKKDFENLEFLLPSMVDEQKEIAKTLFSLDTLISIQSQRLDSLTSHKKGLMQQLFPPVEA